MHLGRHLLTQIIRLLSMRFLSVVCSPSGSVRLRMLLRKHAVFYFWKIGDFSRKNGRFGLFAHKEIVCR